MSLLSPHLKAFMAVVQRGTVHGAGKSLHLTQTGITQRIRTLEQELGATLFLRSRKGMRLTQEGEVLLRYCRGVIDLEGETLNQIQEFGKSKAVFLTLAGPTSVMASRIVELCSDLYHQWPQLHLSFNLTDADDRISLVREGKASLAIVSPEQVPLEMASKVLRPDQYILVASSRWKGRRLAEVLENERVIDFDEGDLTTLNYLKKFQLNSQLKRPRIYANDNEVILKLFSKGVGFGTLTQEVARPYLESGELYALNGGAILEDPLALVWYPRPVMPAYFKALIGVIH